MSKKEVMSFSLTKAEADEIDKLTEDIGYTNRSELIRDGIRMLKKNQLDIEELSGRVEGVIISLYNHPAEADVSRIRHENMDLIKSFMHTDFNHRSKTCCDVLFVSGQSGQVKKLLFDLEVVKNVNEVRLFVA